VKVGLLLFVLFPHFLYAAPYVVADALYPTGSHMISPWSGLSFDIPDGYEGYYDHSLHAFHMSHAKNTLLVFSFANADLLEQWSTLQQVTKTLGITLLKSSKHVQAQHDKKTIHLTLIHGHTTQGGAIILTGTTPQTQTIVDLLHSLRWKKAAIPHRSWILHGKRLTSRTLHTAPQYIDLCPQNNTYSPQQKNWKLIYDIGGEPLLILNHIPPHIFSLDQKKGILRLNQQPFDLSTAICAQ